SADHENDRVQRQQDQQQRRERKTAVRRGDEDDADDRGKDLHRPGEIVVRPHRRPDEHREKEDEECGVRPGHPGNATSSSKTSSTTTSSMTTSSTTTSSTTISSP